MFGRGNLLRGRKPDAVIEVVELLFDEQTLR